MMFTFRIHGRGGHGAESATRILGRALFLAGMEVQTIVAQRMERRGSHIIGYVKAGKDPVSSKDFIDFPDFLLVLDTTLNQEALRGVKRGSIVIFNAAGKVTYPALKKEKAKSYFVPASLLSLGIMKKDVPNTAMLGALSRYFNKLSMKNLKAAIEAELPEMHKENFLAIEEGYKNVK